MLFGKKIRELRDENGVLQRQLAALLEIEMLTLWLADKVLDAVDGEQELSSQAIEVAQEQIKDL